jgi:hypothetical protein
MAMQINEIYELMEGLPAGAWVTISTEEHRVLGYGDDQTALVDEARQMGFEAPS